MNIIRTNKACAWLAIDPVYKTQHVFLEPKSHLIGLIWIPLYTHETVLIDELGVTTK